MVAALKSKRCDQFQHHLDAHPDDWECRLIYADWLEEQGDPFCETQRWMVRTEYHHHFDETEGDNHKWMAFSANGDMNIKCRHLSFDGIGGLSMYPTRHVAELDLHNALAKAGVIHCALIEEVST